MIKEEEKEEINSKSIKKELQPQDEEERDYASCEEVSENELDGRLDLSDCEDEAVEFRQKNL